MDLRTPVTLKLEHQTLYAEVRQYAKRGGSAGKAARLLARLMRTHFAAEEKFALPPLGLLPALAEGTIEPRMAAAITLAKKLHAELPNLLGQRHAIVAAVEELIAAAADEGQSEMVGFAERLMLHEQTEEQVSFPTAILIGKYLQLRLKD
jgi:hypothetical protein